MDRCVSDSQPALRRIVEVRDLWSLRRESANDRFIWLLEGSPLTVLPRLSGGGIANAHTISHSRKVGQRLYVERKMDYVRNVLRIHSLKQPNQLELSGNHPVRKCFIGSRFMSGCNIFINLFFLVMCRLILWSHRTHPVVPVPRSLHHSVHCEWLEFIHMAFSRGQRELQWSRWRRCLLTGNSDAD